MIKLQETLCVTRCTNKNICYSIAQLDWDLFDEDKKIRSCIKIYFKIIVMDGCRVRAVGTKSSIENTDSELAAEWRIVDSKRKDQNHIQKIAKDRWSLVKLVHRIGMNKMKRVSDGSWIIDRDAHVVNVIKSRILYISGPIFNFDTLEWF